MESLYQSILQTVFDLKLCCSTPEIHLHMYHEDAMINIFCNVFM